MSIEYYKNNKENMLKKQKEYYLKNIDKVKEYRKNWRLKNIDERRKIANEYYKNNKEEITKKRKQYRENNKERLKEYWQKQTILKKEYRKYWKIKNNYNLSKEEYEIILEKSKNHCKICGKEKKLYIDHCHKTQKVRGLLCDNCNKGLGHFVDNIEYLKKAIYYLETSQVKEVSQ